MSRSSREDGLDLAALLRDIGGDADRARDLDPARASTLFAAMLAGQVPEPDLGALLTALRKRGTSIAEATIFLRALDDDVVRLDAATEGSRPVVLAAYGATQHGPDPVPLLALLLQRYGVPVLVHGPANGDAVPVDDRDDHAGREASREQRGSRPDAAAPGDGTLEILLELGIEPARHLADAQRLFTQHRIAYVPLPVLAPGFARLLGHRARLGGRSFADEFVPLIDPFHGEGYRVVGVTPPETPARMRDLLIATRAHALLRTVEDATVASPQRYLRLETFIDGVGTVCGEKEAFDPDEGAAPAATGDAASIAAWITQVLAGSMPVPTTVIAQLACCLGGSRRAFA